MNPKERIEQLVETLNQANVEYYLHDNPRPQTKLIMPSFENI